MLELAHSSELYPRAVQEVYCTQHERALKSHGIVLLQTVSRLLDYFWSLITMRLNRSEFDCAYYVSLSSADWQSLQP